MAEPVLLVLAGALAGGVGMRVYDVLRERRLLHSEQARLELERAEKARQVADEDERQALRAAHDGLTQLAHTSTQYHYARLATARRGEPYSSPALDDLELRRQLDLYQQEIDRHASLLMRSGLRRMLGQLRTACERPARCEDPAKADRLHASAITGIRVAQGMIGARLRDLEEGSPSRDGRKPTRGRP